MNISKINLNLLIAFDALLSERHVTRAGEKIFITQSAMSSALAQLRELFNDPLLIREGKSMEPTSKALALAPKIKCILKDIEQTVTPTEFDPATSHRTFTIGMSDKVEFIMLPRLLPLLNKHAPNVHLKVIHLNALDRKEPFDGQQLDIGIGAIYSKQPDSLIFEDLYSDGIAVMAHCKHPLMQKKLTLKKYLSAKHISIIMPDTPHRSRIDSMLDKLGVERKTIISVSHMIPAIFSVAKTPYLITTSEQIAERFAKPLKLAIQPPPFEIERMIMQQAWPKHLDNDAGNIWLRKLIKCATKDLPK